MRNNQPVTGREYPFPQGKTVISYTNQKGQITRANDEFVTLSGFTREELMGQPHNIVRHPDMPPEAFRDLWDTLKKGRPWSGIVKNRRKDGDHYWVRAYASPMADGSGYVSVRVAATRQEISAAEALYARMFRDSSICLDEGQVVSGGVLSGMLRRLSNLSISTRLWLMALNGVTFFVLGGVADGLDLGLSYQIGLGVVGSAALLLQAGLLTRKLKQGLLQSQSAADSIAKGDLAKPMPPASKDELGSLNASLAVMRNNLHELIASVREGISALNMTASEVSVSARSSARISEQQSDDSSGMAAAVEELTASIEHVSENASETHQISHTSSAHASEGGRVIHDAANEMEGIAAAVNHVAETIRGLESYSTQISGIANSIREIADQTNLLALNAAIEAARAGEHCNIPILSGSRVLGVIVFYLPHGTPRSEDDEGFLVRCAAVLSLVIELRLKELALEQKVQELSFQKKTLDEHAIVSITDASGNITYVNDKFCEISGYSQDELLGKNHRILKSGEHSGEFYEELWQTISAGKPWHGNIKNRKKQGGYYWVNATIVPFLDSNGLPYQYVATRTDITPQKEMEEALRQAQSVAQMGSWSLDGITNHLFWSDEIYRIFGIDQDSFGASLEAFVDTIHPEDKAFVLEQFQRSIEGVAAYDLEHRIVRQDTGEVRWVHERCIHQRDSDGTVFRSDGTVQDITNRKKIELALRDSENRFRLMTKEIKDYAIVMLDPQGRVASWNEGARRIKGYEEEEIIGQPMSLFYTAEDNAAGKPAALVADAILHGRVEDEGWRMRKDGTQFFADVVITTIYNESEQLVGFAKITRDITERKQAQEKIQHMAHHDALTGLPNRALFSDRLKQAIIASHRNKARITLMFIDLDKFKPINDSLGHEVGDLLLENVAKRMRGCVRESDTVGRIGGDEFVVLLHDVREESGGVQVAESIRHSLNQPFELGGHTLNISSSIGLAFCPDHGEDEVLLTKNADIAMYLAKHGGRDRVVVYQPGMTL